MWNVENVGKDAYKLFHMGQKFFFLMIVVAVLFLGGGCTSRSVRTAENVHNTQMCARCATVRNAAYARQAASENLPNISNLMEAMALGEEIQAQRMQRFATRYGLSDVAVDTMVQVKSTVDNLKCVVRFESYLSQTALPIFVEAAGSEGAYRARNQFEWAQQIAGRRADYCRDALKCLVRDSSDRNVVNSWSVCQRCGNIYRTAVVSSVCEICGEPACRFALFQ